MFEYFNEDMSSIELRFWLFKYHDEKSPQEMEKIIEEYKKVSRIVTMRELSAPVLFGI